LGRDDRGAASIVVVHAARAKAVTTQTPSPQSKTWRRFVALCLLLAVSVQVSPLHAQTVSPKRAVGVAADRRRFDEATKSGVEGSVSDSSGKLLAGALVRLEQEGWEIARTNTSATGEYRFAVERTGKPYSLCVSQTDFFPARTNLMLGASERLRADFRLFNDTSIRGTVLALDNLTPLRDVVVQAIRMDANTVESETSDLQTGALQPGLMGEYFQFDAPLSDFPRSSLLSVPTLRRVDRSINFPSVVGPFAGTELDDNFHVRWTGLLHVETARKYTFFMLADDGVRLFLDGKEVLNNGGRWNKEESCELELAAGDHPLVIDYYQAAGGAGCTFSWMPEGRAKEVVPPEVLFHRHAVMPATSARRQPRRIVTVLSDAKGGFRFRHLDSGRYQVRCHILGGVTNSEPVIIEENLQSAGYPPQLVDFHVAPFKKGTWRTYKTRDGLLSNQTFKIFPDLDGTGMLWLATGGGLCRFDGKDSINFSLDDGLKNSFVNAFLRMPDGTMWLGTEVGLTRYEPASGNVKTFTKADGLLDDRIFAIGRDPSGKIWIGTWPDGVSLYDGKWAFQRA